MILGVVIAFGILVPLYKGVGFLDARIVAAYACLALLFVGPASAELASAENRDSPVSELLAKIAIIVAWGWGITLLILATAVVTVNIANRRGTFFTPPLPYLAALLLFSLTASVAIAMLCALLSRRLSAPAIKAILRAAFLVILLVIVFGWRLLPDSVTGPLLFRLSTRRGLGILAWRGAAASAVVAVMLLLVLLRTRPRRPFAKIPMAENPHEGGG